MHFSNPLALLLLTLLIPIIWLGWPSRGYGRGREIGALALRVGIVVLLVLAAAGLELRRGSDAVSVVYLMDASDSMSPASTATGRAYIAESLGRMGPEDQAAVVLFGGDALVERSMSPGDTLQRFSSVPVSSQTDLAEAVRLGIALFPQDTARRLVLLTDGRETTGDALAAAKLAVQTGIEFLIVPLAEPSPAQEYTLVDVDLPMQLIEGEAFDLAFTLHARRAGDIVTRIIAGGEVVFEGAAELEPGSQTFRIPLVAGEAGFTSYTVRISAPDDGYYQNNELAAFTQVIGPPKILLVAPPEGELLPYSGEARPDEYSALAAALETAGFTVDLARPSALSFELSLLSEYASIILVDVPARDLSRRQMDAVQSYVRDLGGGLLVVGGPTSYGVGGYFRTALEETLPVDMEIKDEERRPTLTMVFIIDHSGSMESTSGGQSKLELAKEAAIRSVELLFPGDRVGVIAFDDSASWVVPITDLADPDSVIGSIASIGGGGGTDILAGLQAMADVLPSDPALVRHVILLTDGGASPLGIPTLVENLYQDHGITLTTVGVGSDAAEFLEDIAILGGGRYHFTDRPESIPNIFTEETTLATRSYIVEERFFPALVSRSAIVAQISEVPPLHGYVAASAKQTAQTVLAAENGDPILAVWQYGLGRAVAWTSDASARWARDWVAWPEFPTFWAQAVRFTISERSTSPLQVDIRPEGELAQVQVDAVSESGAFLNRYLFTMNVIAPDGRSVEQISLDQSEPGRYLGAFRPDADGVYLLRFDGVHETTGETVSTIAGWVRAYSPEYAQFVEDPDFLTRLADSTGGAVVPVEQTTAPFARPNVQAAASQPLWPELLILALLLLPLDIAVRRLALEWRDLVRAWNRVRARFAFQTAGSSAAQRRPSRVSSLLRAKERAEERRERDSEEESGSPEDGDPTRERPPLVIKAEPERAESGRSEPEGEIPTAQKPTGEEPEPGDRSEVSTTAALLARKRARRKEDD